MRHARVALTAIPFLTLSSFLLDPTPARAIGWDARITIGPPRDPNAIDPGHGNYPGGNGAIVPGYGYYPEYSDYWTLKWGDLLRSNRANLGGAKGMWSFTNWIRGQLQQNRPADQFVRDLLTAQGSSWENPDVNYLRVLREPGKMTEDVSQTFLGVRFNCNKCHDHPFER